MTKRTSLSITSLCVLFAVAAHALAADDWNELTILAEGNRLRHWLNGHLAIDVMDNDSRATAKSGILAFQLHSAPPMTIELRQIRLRNLKTPEKQRWCVFEDGRGWGFQPQHKWN